MPDAFRRHNLWFLAAGLGLLAVLLAAAWTQTTKSPEPATAQSTHLEQIRLQRIHHRQTRPPAAATPVVLEGKPRPAVKKDTRPNIVLITTDDQTMSDMAWMPNVKRLIGGHGVSFANALSQHPLCCPARAEILTGQYAQNNRVRTNKDPLGGFIRLRNSHTLATWLHQARYQTAFIGKYLNRFPQHATMQPGWDIFNPTLKGVYAYYDYTMFDNGRPKAYPRLYNSDLLSRESRRYIKRFSSVGRPFFLWASYVAPHGACSPEKELSCWGKARPAHRDEHLFPTARSPSFADPAYNEADVADKPPDIANNAPMSDHDINEHFLARIRSLQAVDKAVAKTIATLRRTGELDNTLVVFATDNAFLLGEHRFMGKDVPYEQAMRIPLMMRGPGVPVGETRNQTSTLLDLVPTFLGLADQSANLPIDGRDLFPFLSQPSASGPDTVLIQAGPRYVNEVPSGWYYRGVRTDRYTYVHYQTTGFTEMYDRQVDPAELTNIAGDPGYVDVEHELARRTAVLKGCSGSDCLTQFGPTPDSMPLPLMIPPR